MTRRKIKILIFVVIIVTASCAGHAFATDMKLTEHLKRQESNLEKSGAFLTSVSSAQQSTDNVGGIDDRFRLHDNTEVIFKSYGIDHVAPPVVREVSQMSLAFITNFAIHEIGHMIFADEVGAKAQGFDLFKKNGDQFFIGISTYSELDGESKLPYSLAGEVAADFTFEHALRSYRKDPTVYNTSLLFFSGTDFLWYCTYAFYLSKGNEYYDPVSISKETGVSKDVIFSIALVKTIINAARFYTGKDFIIPRFGVSKRAAMINFIMKF